MALSLLPIRATLDHLLYAWLGVERLCAHPRFAEHGRETFDAVLDLNQQLAADKFEPHNRLADTEEPHFDGQRVHLPAATAEACAAYAASGMLAAAQDHAHGGMQLPCTVEMAANSFYSAASIGLKAYSMLTIANANCLMAHGTPVQQRVFAQPQYEGRWFGTMNLSEPQAGSSLSDISTRAVPDGEGFEADPLGPRYRLTGRKMWISGGEHDLSENIVHLVLAKVPGPDGKLPPGTRGIALFIVPKIRVSAEGQLTGERNDVVLAGVNHKLGYRGTTNTLLNYGEQGGAIGYRVGEVGAGLRCMFHMMNEARIQVGLGAAMLGYAGFVASLAYARERRQGRPVGTGPEPAKDAAAPPVALIEHADVKRMLLAQKAYAEGGVALALYCARLVDTQHVGAADEAAEAGLMLELLTPIVKSWPSEWCLEGNSLAIQVLGGYGYTRDFPVEQHWRDNRLNMIHEGAHGIHGIDLLGRKLRLQGGAALTALRARIDATVAACAGDAQLAGWGAALQGSFDALAAAAGQAWASGNAEAALANATRYLQAFGHGVLAWIWLDLARLSRQALATLAPDSASADFHHGKLAAAAYFHAFELPLVAAWLRPVAAQERLLCEVRPGWLD